MSKRNSTIRQAMYALSRLNLSDKDSLKFINNFAMHSGIKNPKHLKTYITDCRINYCSAHSKVLLMNHRKRLGDMVVDVVHRWEEFYINSDMPKKPQLN